MMAVVARIRVVQGKDAEFEAVMKELQGKVRAQEPGCLQYDICRAREPNSYTIMERYQDEQALKDHSASPHVAEGIQKVMPLLDGGPQIDILTVVQ